MTGNRAAGVRDRGRCRLGPGDADQLPRGEVADDAVGQRGGEPHLRHRRRHRLGQRRRDPRRDLRGRPRTQLGRDRGRRRARPTARTTTGPRSGARASGGSRWAGCSQAARHACASGASMTSDPLAGQRLPGRHGHLDGAPTGSAETGEVGHRDRQLERCGPARASVARRGGRSARAESRRAAGRRRREGAVLVLDRARQAEQRALGQRGRLDSGCRRRRLGEQRGRGRCGGAAGAFDRRGQRQALRPQAGHVEHAARRRARCSGGGGPAAGAAPGKP